VWSEDEYHKLWRFDGETSEQEPGVFLCHRQDGRLCAGWVAVHDMDESLGFRLGLSLGLIAPADADEIRDYTTDVPLFDSGLEAAAHGVRELERPGPSAVRMIRALARRQA